MAVPANSTPAPDVARLPHTYTPSQELEHLLRVVRPSLDRIGELNRLLDEPNLPQSGLRLVGTAGGGLLFRGGRDA